MAVRKGVLTSNQNWIQGVTPSSHEEAGVTDPDWYALALAPCGRVNRGVGIPGKVAVGGCLAKHPGRRVTGSGTGLGGSLGYPYPLATAPEGHSLAGWAGPDVCSRQLVAHPVYPVNTSSLRTRITVSYYVCAVLHTAHCWQRAHMTSREHLSREVLPQHREYVRNRHFAPVGKTLLFTLDQVFYLIHFYFGYCICNPQA